MRAVLYASILLCVTACGDSDDGESFDYYGTSSDSTGGAAGQGPVMSLGQSATELSIQDALVLPQFGAQLGQQLTQGGAYAVLIATQASGGSRPIITGTVTLSGQSPTYESTPSDALILIVDRSEYRYEVTAFQYTQGIESVGEYFDEPHQFAATVSLQSESLSVTVGSSYDNRALEMYMRGEVGTQTNGLLQMNLSLTDRLASDIDGYSGIEYEHGTTLAGEIQNADGSILIRVSDTELYHAVAFDRIAENRHHFIEHEISLNGVQYAVRDGRIRSAFVDGCPTDFDYWIGEGVLLRDGSALGQISLTRQSGALVVSVNINNEAHVLETHPLCN